MTFIEQRRWADAVTALEQAQVEEPGPAAIYWLAQARFERTRHDPPIQPLERLAHWQQVAADLAAASRVAGTRVEVDLTLLALEIRVVRTEILGAVTDLATQAAARRPGARHALAALARRSHAAPDGLSEGHRHSEWLVTLAPHHLKRCRWARLMDLGAGVWLGQALTRKGRRPRIVGYFWVVEIDANDLRDL